MRIHLATVPMYHQVGTLVGTLVGTQNSPKLQGLLEYVPTVPTSGVIALVHSLRTYPAMIDHAYKWSPPNNLPVFGGNSGNSGNTIRKSPEIQHITRSHTRSQLRRTVGTRHIPGSDVGHGKFFDDEGTPLCTECGGIAPRDGCHLCTECRMESKS